MSCFQSTRAIIFAYFCTIVLGNLHVLNGSTTLTVSCLPSETSYLIDRDGSILRKSDSVTVLGGQCGVGTPVRIHFQHNTAQPTCVENGTDVIVIKSYWGSSYFHYVVNELQRFLRAEVVVPDIATDSSWTVLVSDFKYKNNRQNEWADQIIGSHLRLANKLPPTVRRVLVAPGASCGGFADPSIVALMRQKLNIDTKRRLLHETENPYYVWFDRPSGSRSFAPANLEKTLQAIEQSFQKNFGVPIERRMHDQTHNLQNAIESVGNATLIAGPHGAGFTNLLFAREATLVLEIHPRVYSQDKLIQPCYTDLASEIGLLYVPTIAEKGGAYNGVHLEIPAVSIFAAMYTLREQYVRLSGPLAQVLSPTKGKPLLGK